MLAVSVIPVELYGIVQLIFFVLIALILIRVVMSYFPGTSYSEGGRLIHRATDWILAPIQRVVPPAGGIDFSPLIATVLLVALEQLLLSGDLVATVVDLIRGVVVLIIILLFVRIFFGFFRMDPWHPVVQMVMRGSEPFARPFRTWFPRRSGQFDMAPVASIVVLLVIWWGLGFLLRH